jgi:hypothetical protein
MKQKLKVFILILMLPLLALVFLPKVQSQMTQSVQVQTAGQKFKNIKVLNDIPADQLGKVMNIFAASLGVKCNFCHVSETEPEKDGKEEKEIARKMITMTFMLNKSYFDNKLEVTCNTCHQGHNHPVSAISLTPSAPPAPRPAESKDKPAIDAILDNYVKALGGKEALDKIKTRVIKATRVEPDGKTIETEDVYQKAPNKSLVITAYGKYVVTEGYDGAKAWKRGNGDEIILRSDETEQIAREAQFFQPVNIKAMYAQIGYALTDKIKDREVYVVRATTAAGLRERLYFDVQTDLLARRIAFIMTVFGNFPVQVDYEDYKDFDSVKVPMTTRWAMPNLSWTRKVLEVKNNVPIDDAKFSNPIKQ